MLVILLLVIEVLVNVWLNFFYRCEFEDSEVLKNLDVDTKRKICVESLGLEYSNDRVKQVDNTKPNSYNSLVYFNNQGFRGPDFYEEKSEKTYRIFTVGGSTTYSIGVLDNQTWPATLQKKFNENNLPIEIEVINVGWPRKWSVQETEEIKIKWINFEPDLFLVYDGLNDLRKDTEGDQQASAELWKERWLEICKLGKEKNFDTIVTLQPFAGTGKRIPTIQETIGYHEKNLDERLALYPPYIEQLEKLNSYCTKTADFRGIFDHIEEAIFYDAAHTGIFGNEIVAENFYELSLPLVIQKMKNFNGNNDEMFNQDAPGSDGATGPKNIQVTSENFEFFYEKIYYNIKDLIFLYKTPRIYDLIFQ